MLLPRLKLSLSGLSLYEKRGVHRVPFFKNEKNCAAWLQYVMKTIII
jgi:hypothetical protein